VTGPEHRAAAHGYLERGFAPVGWVIIDGRKAAVSMKGQRYADYTVTHADIDRWPDRWQTGLAMCQRSGHWALDLDCGEKRTEDFFGSFIITRPTATNLTARGFHMLYRGAGLDNPWPRDGIWSADWPDVQVRSNGFIAVWPSVHPSGALYRWLDNSMPVVPGQLMLTYRPERLPRPGSGHSGGSGHRDGGPDGDLAFYAEHGIPMGWQDSELHRLACRHVRSMDHSVLFGWLWAAVMASAQNQANPWRPEDVAAKIRRAAEFAQREDSAAMAAWHSWQGSRP
jgi:hypothetical protein